MHLSERIHCLPPLGFGEALYLWKDAALVLTDSGGLQEKATTPGVPCVTMRDNTERPVTCEIGPNQLVGNDPARVCATVFRILDGEHPRGRVPPLWDGNTAERIVGALVDAHRSA